MAQAGNFADTWRFASHLTFQQHLTNCLFFLSLLKLVVLLVLIFFCKMEIVVVLKFLKKQTASILLKGSFVYGMLFCKCNLSNQALMIVDNLNRYLTTYLEPKSRRVQFLTLFRIIKCLPLLLKMWITFVLVTCLEWDVPFRFLKIIFSRQAIFQIKVF